MIVEMYPEHFEIGPGVCLYVDDENRPILIAAGEIDRFEMADRVYLTVAPILGIDELEKRMREDLGRSDGRALSLALRVEWRSIRQNGEASIIGPVGVGAPVTVCSLDGLVEAEEIAGA